MLEKEPCALRTLWHRLVDMRVYHEGFDPNYRGNAMPHKRIPMLYSLERIGSWQ